MQVYTVDENWEGFPGTSWDYCPLPCFVSWRVVCNRIEVSEKTLPKYLSTKGLHWVHVPRSKTSSWPYQTLALWRWHCNWTEIWTLKRWGWIAKFGLESRLGQEIRVAFFLIEKSINSKSDGFHFGFREASDGASFHLGPAPFALLPALLPLSLFWPYHVHHKPKAGALQTLEVKNI